MHVHSFGLSELQGRDPALSLHLRARLQVIRLRTTVRDHKVAGVLHCDVGCGQIYSTTACVAHLRLGPERERHTHTFLK